VSTLPLMDVSAPESVKLGFECIAEQLGRLGVLINIAVFSPFEERTLDGLQYRSKWSRSMPRSTGPRRLWC